MSQTIEEKLLRFFQNNEIARERKEENKELLPELVEHFKQSSEDGRLALQLPNGEYAVLESKFSDSEALDKDGLAQELLVAKDELKTAYDIAILTERGRLTADQVSKHTHPKKELKMSIRKRKTPPRWYKRG